MVFDTVGQRFLAVDGLPPQIKELNGTSWQTIATVPFQVLFLGGRACFDSLRGRVVLVGVPVNGYVGPCILEWDGTTWQLFNPSFNVSSWNGAAVWDPVRQRTIIADTHLREWDGATLTTHGPLPVSPYGLCFNALSGRPMLPSNPSYEFLPNNTWAVMGPMTPGVSMNFAFHDPVSNTLQTIPVQGWSYRPEVWDGTGWHPVNVGSAGPYGWQNIHAVGLDPATNEIRGITQQGTFRVVRGTQGSVTVTGASCPGSLGTPTLSVVPSTYWTPVPVIGKSIGFNASNVPQYPLGIRYFLFGFSNTVWEATPLPLDLTVVGMPGCFLNQSCDLVTAPLSGGLTIDVPAVPWLVGATFYVQAMGLELFGASGGPGVCMSRSLAARIGVSW